MMPYPTSWNGRAEIQLESNFNPHFLPATLFCAKLWKGTGSGIRPESPFQNQNKYLAGIEQILNLSENWLWWMLCRKASNIGKADGGELGAEFGGKSLLGWASPQILQRGRESVCLWDIERLLSGLWLSSLSIQPTQQRANIQFILLINPSFSLPQTFIGLT